VENLQMFFPIYNILNRPFYSNNYFLNDVYNDEIVIYIKTEESNFEILKTTFLLELKKNNINDFFFYKIQEHRVQEKGLYLVIFDSNKNIINNIIPIFNKLFSNNITFPYQLDISSLLGIFPKSEYKKCKPFLVELSSYLNENIISEDKIILLFLNVYIGSYIVSGLSKDYFVKRFELMLENFETLIGHKNHNVSLFQEEIYKKHLIGSVFKEKQIEGNILKIYGDAMDNWDVSCLPDDEINSVLKSLDFNIIYTNSFYVEYNFINMILNIFMINDFQKLYIFRTIAAFFK
ncbi:hypothetical protein, partial [Flavobacterium oreochromis]|uniref:hypothetical protein n=1 Tax=Flavobacterium oreochromis TaxID=2906078 RepID=UPI001F1AD554